LYHLQPDIENVSLTYKQHTQRNLHKVWDVAYDGYCGGKDLTVMQWDAEGVAGFQEACQSTSRNFSGKSIVCVPYGGSVRVQSPMPMCSTGAALATSDLIVRDIKEFARAQIGTAAANQNLQQDLAQVCDALKMHAEYADIKDAAAGAISGETTTCRIMYEGTSTWNYHPNYIKHAASAVGRGHHGGDAVGMASVRNGP